MAESREPVIIHRRGAKDVALVDAAELHSLTETAHLLRSPKNAQRLIAAFCVLATVISQPESVEVLRQEFGLGKAS